MEKIKTVCDDKGITIVVIPNIIFKNKQDIDWEAVEKYLEQRIYDVVKNIESQDTIYIGKKFAEEYSRSKDTRNARGARAKAKANAVQGIHEIVENATNRVFENNKKKKHEKEAEYGWYYYTTRFALPQYADGKKTNIYNVYRGRLVVNRSFNGKLFLYDLVDIKKEASNPLKTNEW